MQGQVILALFAFKARNISMAGEALLRRMGFCVSDELVQISRETSIQKAEGLNARKALLARNSGRPCRYILLRSQ